MSLFSGSVGLTRYKAKTPGQLHDLFGVRTLSLAFQDIEKTMDEFARGWVHPQDFMDAKRLDFADLAQEPYIFLSMRMDRRRISSKLLKKQLRLQMDRYRELYGSDKPINRVTREGLKEQARSELLRKIPPEPTMVEAVWDYQSGEVWLGTQGKLSTEVFESLFRDTFSVELAYQQPLWLMDEGVHFLTWLWYLSEHIGTVSLMESGSVDVALSDLLVLGPRPGDEGTRVAVHGGESSLAEAREALKRGKVVGSIRLNLHHNHTGEEFTLTAFNGDPGLSSISLPPSGNPSGGWFGMAMERVALIQQVLDIMDKLWALFEQGREQIIKDMGPWKDGE